MGIEDRLRGLERRHLPPDPDEEVHRRERRAYMRSWLDELADAKRTGREPAPWARAISEDFEVMRRSRES